ncbi:MAG: pyruvate kinase [Thermoproteaceae archaeon]|nr:pyruvate kinase [Thermoproteaceae archaeon]
MPVLTKRVITAGPATDRLPPGEFAKLLDLADGVRLNLAHASPEYVKSVLRAVRAYERDRERLIAVLLDLSGPGVRVGMTEPIRITRGSRVTFALGEKSDGSYVPVPSRAFFQTAERGDLILMLDGALTLRVEEAGPSRVVAAAETDGVISSNKAIVIKDKEYDVPSPAERDVELLRKLADVRDDVDYISASLVRSCDDVRRVRSLLGELGYESPLIAKIETKSAAERHEEIIECSDYIVIARGDLGLYYGLESLPVVQRKIASAAITRGRPVAVATQLLDSMQRSPAPTRAEVNDVFTSAAVGVDSLWLTGETSSGKYPVAAAAWLTKILARVEYDIPALPEPQDARDRFAKGLVELARDLNARILVYSVTGTLALRVAKFRPLTAVYVGTPSVRVARALALVWALQSLYLPAGDYKEGLEKLIALRGSAPFVATYGIRGGDHLIKVRFA